MFSHSITSLHKTIISSSLITWLMGNCLERPSSSADVKAHLSAAVTVDSPPAVKVSLFKDLFRGRDDVYTVRWEGKNGKPGYSPAGDKEWDKAASSGRESKKSFRITKLFSLTRT
jgi:hypothetical protein